MRWTPLIALALGLFPSLAGAQDLYEDDRARIGGHFALAMAGEANLRTPLGNPDLSLDPTLGGALRVEVPLHDYFVLGGWFEVLAFEWDAPNAEREPVFNFDLLMKARYPFEIGRDLGLEPYLQLNVGPTIAVLEVAGGDEAWPGWNIGVTAGAALLLDPAGFFFELGWRLHQVFYEQSTALGDADLEVLTNQLAMQIGGFVRL